MGKFYAALEIGTSRTVLAIGEPASDGRLRITCHAEIPSTGVRKSQILDLNQATQSIRSVLHAIERRQDELGTSITFSNAFLAVSGQHIRADPFSGMVQITSSVKENDINEVLNNSCSMSLAKDREILDIVDQDYVLDNLGGIRSPKGMSGRILKHNTLHIHADRARLQDARTAADGVHLAIREPVFAATCAADAVLEEVDRERGTLVLDLGGGSTGYAAYCDGYLVATGVIGLGGDHITSDISQAFQTTLAQAEGLKVREARALVGQNDERAKASPRIRVVPGDNALLDNRTISRQALDTVVNVRVLELADVILGTLEEQELLHRIQSGGVVLTGGGARLRDIAAVLQSRLGVAVRIGRPVNVDGLEEEEFPAEYAVIAGTLLYAHRNYEERSVLDSIWKNFGKVFGK